ncbi:MAG: YunC family protein, partial [Methanoregulaceae archaeon]|nr:YunC family protein [Methanoregulaceae archaeon]
MIQKTVKLLHSDGTGYVIPAGPVNLVNIIARLGMVGCGAFDVSALNNFGYPAARVRPATGNSVATLDDLLGGIVREANDAAGALGVRVGMSGREA